MKAQVAFPPLLSAARALKPYTTTQRWRTRLLYLHAEGPTLTVSATTGDETASVPLDGALGDGWCALPADALIKALAAVKPGGKATTTATVSLHGDDGRLTLSVGDRPTVGLDTDTVDGLPPTVAAKPAPAERPVTAGPVADWHDLIAGVATAAGHEPARPDLAVVRLLRDHPNVVLMAEAIDRHRIHRGTWGQPDGDPVDLRMQAAATRRAARLLHTLDPHGHLRVHADDHRVYWRTDRVRLAATTTGGWFPNLEKIREDVLDDTTSSFTVDRADLLAAATTVRQPTADTRHPRLCLQPAGTRGLDVVVRADSGAPLYIAQVSIQRLAGPPSTLTLDPAFTRDAVAFLDGDHIDVHATADRLPVYLAGQRRHAIVMQIAA